VNRLTHAFRRLVPLLGAGMMLQASSCQLNTSEIAASLTVSFLNNLIASYVFGAFNLVP